MNYITYVIIFASIALVLYFLGAFIIPKMSLKASMSSGKLDVSLGKDSFQADDSCKDIFSSYEILVDEKSKKHIVTFHFNEEVEACTLEIICFTKKGKLLEDKNVRFITVSNPEMRMVEIPKKTFSISVRTIEDIKGRNSNRLLKINKTKIKISFLFTFIFVALASFSAVYAYLCFRLKDSVQDIMNLKFTWVIFIILGVSALVSVFGYFLTINANKDYLQKEVTNHE
ncbi:MAG: hypothetical protein WCR67_04570 [Bacilli bacterium]